MGIKVTDELVLDNGLSVNEYYISLGENETRIQKRGDTYVIDGFFGFWITKEARDGDARPIGQKLVRVEQSDVPTGNIYDLLYTKLKEGYVYVQDVQ
jgi:hypothetical protein